MGAVLLQQCEGGLDALVSDVLEGYNLGVCARGRWRDAGWHTPHHIRSIGWM